MRKIATFLVTLCLIVSACSMKEPRTENIKIGAFLSMTGATSAYGISASNAIKLATDETNAAGGINGKQIQIDIEDDESNTQQVPEVVNHLIKEHKVHALIAEPVSTRAMVAAPIAQQNKVVMISSASVKPELTMQGDYIFRACFISSTEGDAIAKFAVDHLKAKSAAIILDDKNDYALVLAGFFADSFKKRGGQIVSEPKYEANAKDLTAQINAIKTAAPDIVFAPGFYTTATLVASEVKKSGIKSTLIGSDGWDSPNLLNNGGGPFEGVYLANHFWAGSDDPIAKKFMADYRAKYGVEPDALAATAYDAARMLFDAFKRAASTESTAVRNALAQTKDFPGVTGKITLDSNRNAQVPVYMLRIESGKFHLQP
ncbi:MAG: branched-chain amino acid transport system substrate-binding protein [Acidobacteriota bacterium]|jgi:branched-chain amino acid transport system substrate-binding protein